MRRSKSGFIRTKTARVTVLLSCLFAVFVWLAAGVLDYFVRYRDVRFWDVLIFNIPLYQFYIRSLLMLFFVTPGLTSAAFIDRLKDREEDLRASSERFQSVAQTANDAIISVDDAGIITFWNRAAEKILGYRADQIVGEAFARLVPGLRRDANGRDVTNGDAVGAVGRERTFDMTGQRADGTEFPMELSLSRWKDEDGTNSTVIIRDITERKRAHEQLAAEHHKMLSLARNVLQSQERERLYLAGEIQERLLGSLDSAVSRLEALDTSGLTEEQRDRLLQLRTDLGIGAQEGRQLVEEIEPISRPEATLAGTIRRAVDLIFWKSFVKTAVNVPASVPDVGQALKLDVLRVAEEALLNIRKHAQATRVWVSVEPNDGHLVLKVKDDGVGFDSAAVLSATDGNYGLLAMQQRAALFGGDLSVDSTPGEGTMVRATFSLS